MKSIFNSANIASFRYFAEGFLVSVTLIILYSWAKDLSFDFSQNFWYVAFSGWILGLIKAIYLDVKGYFK
jgi:uncharacterized membrane protein YdcZ (DUF606 family)